MMLVLAAAVLAQSPPLDLVQRVAAAHATVLQMDRVFADSVWPDFRPDTIPVLYVAPSIGTLLAGWRGPLPPGFTPLGDVTGTAWQPVAARGAASTGTQLAGRPTAQVVVQPGAGVADLVGLSAGPPLDASFTTAVVEDRRGKSARAVIGPADSVRITSRGQPVTLVEGQALEATDVRIETPVLTLRSARAALERRGAELLLRPKP
jgi:hypothetical protein